MFWSGEEIVAYEGAPVTNSWLRAWPAVVSRWPKAAVANNVRRSVSAEVVFVPGEAMGAVGGRMVAFGGRK